MSSHTIEARTHGRYLVDRPPDGELAGVLVGFHGYKENAEAMLDALTGIRGDRSWLLASVQALNRFYTRDNEVVANWMTRQDRDLAIADNLAYVAAVVAAVRREYVCPGVIVYAGFSQGVATAYRAAAFAAAGGAVPRPAGAIMLAGDVPPDVAPVAASLPPILLGRGTTDRWYTEAKAAADLAVLREAGVSFNEHVFDGGHVWDASFITRAGEFLDGLTTGPRPDSAHPA